MKRTPSIDHGVVSKAMEPKPDPYLEDSNKAWKDMILIKRYEHHTLFYHKTRNGNGWHECFLNRDIDKDK